MIEVAQRDEERHLVLWRNRLVIERLEDERDMMDRVESWGIFPVVSAIIKTRVFIRPHKSKTHPQLLLVQLHEKFILSLSHLQLTHLPMNFRRKHSLSPPFPYPHSMNILFINPRSGRGGLISRKREGFWRKIFRGGGGEMANTRCSWNGHGATKVVYVPDRVSRLYFLFM